MFNKRNFKVLNKQYHTSIHFNNEDFEKSVVPTDSLF